MRGCRRSPAGGASWEYEAAVIGGGPAGASAAAMLARAGRRVLLVERERFPRFHIGESLLPSSNAVFRELGVADLLAGKGFVKKHGAAFLTPDGSERSRIEFCMAPRVREPDTYHVPRAEFDALLLDHAERSGAEVRQSSAVRAARFHADGAELDFETAGGELATARVGVVLDASGRQGVLARKLGLRVPDSDLRKVAVYAHYRGVDRPAGRESGDIRILCRGDLGWIWVIPIDADRTSIGVVCDRTERVRERHESPEGALDRLLSESPAAREIIAGAERIGPARWEGDFSYSTRSYTGDRWLLVGDAGSFLDPIFSTGVLLAVQSGVEAARAVNRALERGGDLSGRRFRAYERTQRRRYRFYRRYVKAFYTPGFREVLLHPEGWPAGARALISVLAGDDRPSLLDRLRLNVIFAIVRRQSRSPAEKGERSDPTASRSMAT